MLPLTHIYNSITDEELMLLIQKGNESAFTELHRRYHQKLFRFFYRMTGKDRKSSEDMLQELWIKVIQNPEKFHQDKSFSPWVYKIASNMCLNELRNAKNRLRLLEENFTLNETELPTFSSDIDKNTFIRNYLFHFENLDTQQQLLLTLHFEEELSLKEIAPILCIPEGTVRSRLFYLLKKLSALLYQFNPQK